MALGEAPKKTGDDLGADALERPDAKASGVPGLERAHVGLRREEPRLNRVGVAEQDLAGFGEGDRAWATGALDESQPDDPLERCNLLRDRGLRVPELLRRLPEGTLVGDCLERDEMTKIESEPAISFHDRTLPNEQAI